MDSLSYAIVGHLVGDYLLQNGFLAINKKWSTPICALHCLIWSLAVIGFARWPCWTLPVLLVTHFAQDRTGLVAWYMRTARQSKFAQPPLAPWSLIVVDNVLHLVVLSVVARLV